MLSTGIFSSLPLWAGFTASTHLIKLYQVTIGAYHCLGLHHIPTFIMSCCNITISSGKIQNNAFASIAHGYILCIRTHSGIILKIAVLNANLKGFTLRGEVIFGLFCYQWKTIKGMNSCDYDSVTIVSWNSKNLAQK